MSSQYVLAFVVSIISLVVGLRNTSNHEAPLQAHGAPMGLSDSNSKKELFNSNKGKSCIFMDVDRVELMNGKVLTPYTVQGDNILTVSKAYIRDNAESPNWEWLPGPFRHSHEAILSVQIFSSNDTRNWTRVKMVPLPGQHYTGDESSGPFNGYPKLQWLDNECVEYANLGVLAWDYFPGKYIKIVIEEGDKVGGDDILLNVWGNAEDLRNNWAPLKLEGTHGYIWVKNMSRVSVSPRKPRKRNDPTRHIPDPDPGAGRW